MKSHKNYYAAAGRNGLAVAGNIVSYGFILYTFLYYENGKRMLQSLLS